MVEHIVIDARESGTTTGRYIDKLVEHLHKLDSNYRITVLTKSQRVNYIKMIAPTFSVIESNFQEFTFAEQFGLLKQINGLQPDLVFFSMVQQPVLYRGTVVTTMQDLTTLRFKNPLKNQLVFWGKQRIYALVNNRVAKKSAHLITPTQFVKNDVVSYCGIAPDKVTVTYESADKITEKSKAIPNLRDKDFIMYVGRPQPHKNLDRLVESFAILQNNRPDLHLVLAGKEDELYKRLKESSNSKKIKNIIFTGFVAEGELRWLYENAEAYVFPSLSEGFGLPGLEAMAHGCPVVSSNATCLPEVYEDAAHYFDPKNIDDMSIKIGEVLDSKELREQLIKNGREQLRKYSWEKLAKETLAVFDKVLDI